MCGLSLHCHADFHTFRGEIATLLVPGVMGVEEKPAEAAAVSWLRKAPSRSRRVGFICTSAFLLARSGLLDGRRAATHWAFANELARRHPKVKVDSNPIWIQDEKFAHPAFVARRISQPFPHVRHREIELA